MRRREDRRRRKGRVTGTLQSLATALLAAACASSGERELAISAPLAHEPLPAPVQEPEPSVDPVPPVPMVELDLELHRASRPIPPGLPAAQATERERERNAALEQVRTWMAEGSGVRERLFQWLSGDDPRSWTAAARIAGRVGLYDAGPFLAPGVAPDAPTWKRLTASRALHELYGRWFVEPAEVQPYLAKVKDGEGTRLLVQGLLAQESLARERLLGTLAHVLDEAVPWLEDPDPEVRAGVARLIGGRLGDSELDTLGLTQALLDRLSVERDPRAFHEALEAVLVPLEGAPATSPLLPPLRRILTDAVREPDLRALSVARAIARVPWYDEAGSDSGHLHAVDCIARLLQAELSPAGASRPSDPDAIVAHLQALQVLCNRVREQGLVAELRASEAPMPILALVTDPDRIDVVRAAAVRALEPIVLPEDWPMLVKELMDADESPAIAHALLGSLRTILFEFEPGSVEARKILEHVSHLAETPDPDLRRRALRLFAEERLETHVHELDPRFLMSLLESEEIPDLELTLLGLLGRFGSPEMLDTLLVSDSFDELATGEPGEIAALASAIGQLATERPYAAFKAAARLVSIGHAPSRLARTRRALTLVADLAPGALRDLDPEEHRLICAWTWELHDKGASLTEATPAGFAFLRRLVEEHLPAAERADPTATALSEAARYHLLAVVLAELSTTEDEERPEAEVIEAAFAKASEFAPTTGNDHFLARVVRDRARFRARIGDTRALDDFRSLKGGNVLDSSDLREAVSLLDRLGGDGVAGRRATAPESCELLNELVRRPTWSSEPAALRLNDLKELGQRSIDSGQAHRMVRFLHLLDGLPPEPPASDAEVPETAWAGLAREPTHHAELVTLQRRVRQALETVAASDPEIGQGG